MIIKVLHILLVGFKFILNFTSHFILWFITAGKVSLLAPPLLSNLFDISIVFSATSFSISSYSLFSLPF